MTQSFVDGQPPVVSAAWLNQIDLLLLALTTGVPTAGPYYVGNASLFGYSAPLALQIFSDAGSPTSRKNVATLVAQAIGDSGNSHTYGATGLYLEVRDTVGVVAGTRPSMYGLFLSVAPRVARSASPYDDMAPLVVQNTTGVSGANATDVFYVGHNSSAFVGAAAFEFETWLNSNAFFQTVFRFNGQTTSSGFFIDIFDAVLGGEAIRLPNNKGIVARNAGNTADAILTKLNSSDVLVIGGTNVGSISTQNPFILGSGFSAQPPRVISVDGSVLTTDVYCICQKAGVLTLTLPASASNPGKILNFTNYTANTVVSASANVVQRDGTGPSTAILPATAGSWCELISTTADWRVVKIG